MSGVRVQKQVHNAAVYAVLSKTAGEVTHTYTHICTYISNRYFWKDMKDSANRGRLWRVSLGVRDARDICHHTSLGHFKLRPWVCILLRKILLLQKF